MKNLLRFIIRHHFILLFLLMEGISFMLIFQYNPFQHSVFINYSRTVSETIFGGVQNFREYLYLNEINDNLISENVRLRNQLDKKPDYIYLYISDSIAVDTFRHEERDQYHYFPARVINNSVNKQYNYITLDKGRKQGVDADMAVISTEGVVGIISAVSDNYSTVLPVINRHFRLSAKINRNENFGIIEWDGIDPDHVNLREIPIHVELFRGDTIVTSGYSAIFPSDIPVGVVSDYQLNEGNFYEIRVRLLTNFRKLFHVNVIRNYYQQEQENLENSMGYD